MSKMTKPEAVLYHISTVEPRLAAELPLSMLEDAIELFPRESVKALAGRLVDAYRTN